MNNLATEEEQIAALKKWWSDNGNSLLIGVGAALAILFGWKAYENSVIQDKTEASVKYQQLLAVSSQPAAQGDEEANTISYLAEQIKEAHQGSEYAIYAALFIAKDKVASKDYEGALEQLNWVLANTEDTRTQHIVNARIARILSAQGKHDEALAKLVAKEKAFEPIYLEISGDIKRRNGDSAAALEDYKQAYALIKDAPQAQPLLAVKLSDLGVDPKTL